MSEIKTGTKFIAVSVEDELPGKEGEYWVVKDRQINKNCMGWFNGKSFESANVTHWLKQIEE